MPPLRLIIPMIVATAVLTTSTAITTADAYLAELTRNGLGGPDDAAGISAAHKICDRLADGQTIDGITQGLFNLQETRISSGSVDAPITDDDAEVLTTSPITPGVRTFGRNIRGWR
jgi:hypothetical protein